MRILFITQTFLPEIGALSNRMYPFVREFEKKGHTIFVATGMPNYPAGVVLERYRNLQGMTESIEGATVVRRAYFTTPRNRSKWTQLRSYLSFIPAAFRAAWSVGEVDVVFVTSPPLFPFIPAFAIAKLRRAKIVLDIRDLWPDELVAFGAASEASLGVKVLRWLERAAYKSAHLVACTTPAFLETVVARGAAREKTILAPNGADLEHFTPHPSSNPVVNRFNLGEKFVAVYSGLLGLKHGLDILIEVAERLRDKTEIVIFVLGSGPMGATLRSEVETRSLSNVVFGGEAEVQQVPYALARADVCIASLIPGPYLEKIIPAKLFEYMACAKPTIAAIGGEGARVLNEARAGIVVSPGDSKAMADAILTLYSDPERRLAMGASGRDFVAREYSRALTARRVEQALTQLVS